MVRPAGPRVVTTATPVANSPIAARKSVALTARGYISRRFGKIKTLAFSRRDLVVSAELSRLPQARAFAEDAARDFGFDEEAQYQVKCAVNEAVANAIEHGSATPRDEVAIEAAQEEGALALYVRDSGSFRPRVWRGGEISERGRGLDFITQMMDEVDVRPGRDGTEVRMLKRPR